MGNVASPVWRAYHNQAAVSGAPTAQSQAPAKGVRHPWWGGPGTSAGTVAVEGVPAQRVVCLIDKFTRQIVGLTLSGHDGSYAFTGLAMTTSGYLVYALDHTGLFDAVIHDRITPV